MATKHSSIPTDYSSDWLEKLDGRTRLAQACRQRYAALTDDLGGHDHLSYQRRSLAKRAVWLEAVIETQEAALARGEDVDQGRMTQALNSLMVNWSNWSGHPGKPHTGGIGGVHDQEDATSVLRRIQG